MKLFLRACLLLVLCHAASGSPLPSQTVFLQRFSFADQPCVLQAHFASGQADLRLQGAWQRNLSAGMKGENILLATRVGKDNFYVFWLNYRQKAIRLAFYDHRRDRSRLLPLAGFAFIGAPEIIEENNDLRALLFLANRSGNDDIFYYEPEGNVLAQITRTPFSEKTFSWRQKDGQLEIAAAALRAGYRYRFDPVSRRSLLLEERAHPSQRKGAGPAITPDDYNTYIGFGDSITWGQIQGVQRLDLCFLTLMRDVFLPPIYGPATFINLGYPGLKTYDCAQRVNADLDAHSAFYFLLLLGVNDIWNKNGFSLASSLENLEFIVDAALAHGRRVIISTLTPRKDSFSLYQFYWDNLNSLSAGILDLAAAKGIAHIDTLKAFMDNDPPDGWKALLEDIVPGVSKGNHPNADGHRIIGSLFAGALAAFPPLAPQRVAVLNPRDPLRRNAQWESNYESDFSCYHIEFGYRPGELNHSLTTTASHFDFILFPFLPQLYFRIRTADLGNRLSPFAAPEDGMTAGIQLGKNRKCLPRGVLSAGER